MLSESWSKRRVHERFQFQRKTVTVNCIAPGPFLTNLAATLLSPAQKEEFARNTALGRWGDPKELVGPALLLVSDAGSYITGQTIVVDGGYITR